MATSGSTDFSANLTEIIEGAARKIQVIAAGETMTARDFDSFQKGLNALIKQWSATDVHIWTTKEGVLFPAVNQVKYALASSSSDHATEEHVATTVSAAEAAGQTALSVTDDDDIAAADHIGIILDDGTMHWSTVSGTPAGNVVTIADALPSAAAAGNAVFAYTTPLVRPLKIVDWRRYNIASGLDIPMGEPIARGDYFNLPDKTSTGVINSICYDRQRSVGQLYLWKSLARVTDLVKFTWHKPIEDFDSANDDPDFPQEWILCLQLNLAVFMSPEYDVPPEKFNQVAALASDTLDDLRGADREAESVFFQPDMRR